MSFFDRLATIDRRKTGHPILLQWRGSATPWRCLVVATGLIGIITARNFYDQSIAHREIASSQTKYPPSSRALQAFAAGLPGSAAPRKGAERTASQMLPALQDQVSSLVKGYPPSTIGSETRQVAAFASNAVRAAIPQSFPTFLMVPAAKISVALARLTVNEKGTIDVPANTESAGWWQKKRQNSPIVVAGHLDSKTGPAVFYHVQDLRFGDRVFISFDDGSNTSYTVRQIERIDKDKFPSQRVYNSGKGEVRLVTCGGKFNKHTGHYEDNIVVYATPDTV